MTKKYVTWNRFWVNKYCAIDPNEQIGKLWSPVTFTPLSYGNSSTDPRMLALVEYTAEDLSAEAWTRFLLNFSHFCFYEVTATEAKDLCDEWHSPPPGEEFTLSGDSFTIVDNRTSTT